MTDYADKFRDMICVWGADKKYGIGIQLWQTQKGFWKIKLAQIYVNQYGTQFSMRDLNDNQKAKGKANPNISIDPALVPGLCEALLKAAEQARDKATGKEEGPAF